MSTISTVLTVMVVIVWIIYATLRIAPWVKRRWNVWGEVASFLIFAAVVVIIEVVFSRF